jgi:hypothetical protein
MDELLILQKKNREIIEEETRKLLLLGYTQQDIVDLFEALEYISFPIIAEFYEIDNESEDRYN